MLWSHCTSRMSAFCVLPSVFRSMTWRPCEWPSRSPPVPGRRRRLALPLVPVENSRDEALLAGSFRAPGAVEFAGFRVERDCLGHIFLGQPCEKQKRERPAGAGVPILSDFWEELIIPIGPARNKRGEKKWFGFRARG